MSFTRQEALGLFYINTPHKELFFCLRGQSAPGGVSLVVEVCPLLMDTSRRDGKKLDLPSYPPPPPPRRFAMFYLLVTRGEICSVSDAFFRLHIYMHAYAANICSLCCSNTSIIVWL